MEGIPILLAPIMWILPICNGDIANVSPVDSTLKQWSPWWLMIKGGSKYAQKRTRIFRVTIRLYSNFSNWWVMVNLDFDSIFTESVRRIIMEVVTNIFNYTFYYSAHRLYSEIKICSINVQLAYESNNERRYSGKPMLRKRNIKKALYLMRPKKKKYSIVNSISCLPNL